MICSFIWRHKMMFGWVLCPQCSATVAHWMIHSRNSHSIHILYIVHIYKSKFRNGTHTQPTVSLIDWLPHTIQMTTNKQTCVFCLWNASTSSIGPEQNGRQESISLERPSAIWTPTVPFRSSTSSSSSICFSIYVNCVYTESVDGNVLMSSYRHVCFEC